MPKIADIIDGSGETVGSIVSVEDDSGCMLWILVIVLVAPCYPIIMVSNYIRNHGLIGYVIAIPFAAMVASMGAAVIGNKTGVKRGEEWKSLIYFFILFVIFWYAFGRLLSAVIW